VVGVKPTLPRTPALMLTGEEARSMIDAMSKGMCRDRIRGRYGPHIDPYHQGVGHEHKGRIATWQIGPRR
jgi:hypothetical protein